MSVDSTGPVRLHGLVFDAAGTSAQGPRSENQDAFMVDAFERGGLIAVADGMGGERAGRVAADTALATLTAQAPLRSLDAARYAMRAADEAVARAAQESPDDRGGMGCALALLSLSQDRSGEVGWVGANVGDVRVLSRSPDGTVRLETRDHTPAFARWEAGEIALDEIPDTPGANRLQRAVGRGGEADAVWIPARAGWTYLLLSDGVTKAMRLDELGQAMALDDPAASCQAIASKVEERGPDDNYTVVAVRVRHDGADEFATQENPRPALVAAPRAEPARGPLNPPDSVTTRSRTSPLAPLAALLAVAALALAGYALMTALGARRIADQGVDEARAARTSVDSMRSALPPVAMDSAAADTTRIPVSATPPVGGVPR
ncbi:MAG TPA: protein phosphatase 2C domain-containing protein [Longimicrobium sp.]|nr:protein phosphatase 2C domain-containing protein [Longimicrobium sp.]